MDVDASAAERAGTGVPGADLGWYLGVILRRWHEQVEQAVAGVPHGIRGYQILSVVGHNSPPTQIGLAKHLQIDKTVLPYIIDALEAPGLVERKIDPKDRRVRRIALTQRGTAVLAELEAKVRVAEEAVFETAPPQVRDAFLAQVSELAVSIHGSRPSLDPCIAVLDALAEPSAVGPA